MEILGIGPSELIFIIIIALIVLGPKDMQKAGRTIGHWLNRLITSDGWKVMQRATKEIRNLPTNLIREANLEMNQINKDIQNTIGPPSLTHASRQSQPAPTPTLRHASGDTPSLLQPQNADPTPQPDPVIPPPDSNQDA
jgi:sec-independent protein translocase protein TatB